MTTYRRGEVVYVPFQFTAGEKKKSRPAIIISSDDYNQSRSDIVIAGITSNISRTGFVGQVTLVDWRQCGLAKPSVVSGIIQTVRNTQIGRRVGSLTTKDQDALDSILRVVLGL
jgi:mRNA interferase MazF